MNASRGDERMDSNKYKLAHEAAISSPGSKGRFHLCSLTHWLLVEFGNVQTCLRFRSLFGPFHPRLQLYLRLEILYQLSFNISDLHVRKLV